MPAVTCPKCRSRLKIDHLPAAGRKGTCPNCGHGFLMVAAAAPASADEAPAPAATSESARLILGIVIGAFAVLVLVGMLAIPAMLWMQLEPAAVTTPAVEKPVAAPAVTTPPFASAPSAPETPVANAAGSPETPVASVPTGPKALSVDEQEEKDRRERFIALMIQAGLDSREKRHEDALAAYEKALAIYPNDARAKQGWLDVKAASALTQKSRSDDARAKEDAGQLVKQGQEALEKKQYAAALELFKLAVQKAPPDSAANEGVRAAVAALARDESEQKKQADFERHLAAAKLALKAGRHDDALRDLIAAQVIVPDSPAARALQRQVEQELRTQKNEQERRASLAKLVERGNTALLARRYDDAEQLFRQALAFDPGDVATNKALVEASRLARQMRDDFNALMLRGNQARVTGRWFEAAQAYRDALQLVPGNETAQKALREAEAGQDRVQGYQQAMRQGSLAMARESYLEAQAAFQAALQAVPNDPSATQGLLAAQQRLQQLALARQDSDRKAKQANQALQQQRFAEASKLYQEAIKAFPLTPQLAALQQKGDYADAMAKGAAALSAKDFNEASRQFQSALAIVPRDPIALNYLIKSRNAR
jgi:tetratricopeptide (TPR) repeat protein